MRCFCPLFVFVLALPSLAVTLDVVRLPAPSFADGEVSRDAALPADRLDLLRTFRLEMTFESTPSNNVQVALGRDTSPADGRLDAGETDLIVGWDRGEWFLRPHGLRERFACPAAAGDGDRTLALSVRVSAQGVCQPPVFKDGGAEFSFPDLTLSPFPVWLTPGLWTLLRVTARGADAANESVKAVFAADGARIILK